MFLKKNLYPRLLLAGICALTISAITLSSLLYLTKSSSLVTPDQSMAVSPTKANTAEDLRGTINTLIAQKGSLAAWKYLVDEKDNLYTTRVHDLAHLIGSKMYQDYDLESLKKCSVDFAFGCYHGALEEYIAIHGVTSLPDVITYCEKSHPQVALTCYHGVGHGLLSYYTYELPPALQECDTLLPEKNAPFCYRGVFMEFGTAYVTKASASQPLWPCTNVDTRYKLACYNYQMTYLTRIYGNDPVKIEHACMQAETQAFQKECLKGYGHLLGQMYLETPKTILPICQQMSDLNASRCIISAAQETVFQGVDSEKISRVLCQTLPDKQRDECEEKTAVQQKLHSSP